MPVKNAEPYLKACINSIVNQSYSNWELIAIDDSSTDNSYQILHDFSLDYSNIHTFKSAGIGIVDALKQAFDVCKGDYIHRMDADDIMPSKKLELLLKHWQKGSIVTGKVQYFIDNGVIGDGFNKYQNWINDLMETNDLWKDPYLECSLPSPAWLLSRTDFVNIGGFSCKILPEDYDLMFRTYLSNLTVISIKEIIHLWRDSDTRTSRNNPLYFPKAYFPIKVHYFLEADRNSKPLLLWGAGGKGKSIAKLLQSQNEPFIWGTNNLKKIGHKIYNVQVQDVEQINVKNCQVILAVSSPEEKTAINDLMNTHALVRSSDYFWFC